MKRTIALVLIFIFLFITPAIAETSIKAEVDKKSITTDEMLTYKLTIISSEKKLPTPEVPKFEGFNVISQAQSSTISFVKSDIKTILVYAFILAPTDVGKCNIGPSTIKIKDKTYSTEPLEIEVTQGKAKPGEKPAQKPSLPPVPQPETEQPQITL